MTSIFKLSIILLDLVFALSCIGNVQNVGDNDYVALGYEKGVYYKEICRDFFYSGSALRWEYGDEEKQFAEDDRMYVPVTAYEKNGKMVDTDYNSLKNDLNELGISDHAFMQFQQNANGAYYEIDGELYMGTIDGGEWGWDYAYIDSYELLDEITVQYNCIVKSYAGYDDRPFTFILKKNNNVWELYECSDPYAFASYFQDPITIIKLIELEGLSGYGY